MHNTIAENTIVILVQQRMNTNNAFINWNNCFRKYLNQKAAAGQIPCFTVVPQLLANMKIQE